MSLSPRSIKLASLVSGAFFAAMALAVVTGFRAVAVAETNSTGTMSYWVFGSHSSLEFGRLVVTDGTDPSHDDSPLPRGPEAFPIDRAVIVDVEIDHSATQDPFQVWVTRSSTSEVVLSRQFTLVDELAGRKTWEPITVMVPRPGHYTFHVSHDRDIREVSFEVVEPNPS